MANTENLYRKLLGHREGARFCRMDLHTHSPASECSSFTLPAGLDALIPGSSELDTKGERATAVDLLGRIAKGEAVFDAAYDADEVANRPRVSPRPSLGKGNLRDIAKAWIGDIETLPDADHPDLKDRLGRAFRDIENYLASLFFPEDYVMRCHLEGIELVALTDHNHPGYIVPRLHRLGTWFGALKRVNETWRKDLRAKRKPGAKTKAKMVERLELAKKRLLEEFDELSRASDATMADHKDLPKRLQAPAERLEHIESLIVHWGGDDTVPKPLTILPGMEITVSDVHVLSVFPPEWYVPGRIASILRSIGIPEEHWGRGFEAAASSSVQTAIEHVHEAGGIAVPAHSNSDFKGLLRLFRKGLALSKVLHHPALLALETVGGSVLTKPSRKAWQTLEWLDEKRAKPLSFVKGSDAHECRIELDGTGEDIGERYTNVKIDIRPNDTPEEVFRSLRLALLSGQNRVVEYPTEDGYNYFATGDTARVPKVERERLVDWRLHRPAILGLTVEGAGSYADGLEVRFNPYLNNVIGSGGKSILVRMVGYAFGALAFLPESTADWLPQRVRAFWQDGEKVYMGERSGKSADPNGPDVRVRWLERAADGAWTVLHETGDPEIDGLAAMVEVWPPADVQNKKAELTSFEDEVIEQLAKALSFGGRAGRRPLLVNQPHEIFNGERLFREFLAKPRLKNRQIIWSTGSPNVPAAMDAEKILVTEEVDQGKRMELVCGGDLHEDEIRDALMNRLEGGRHGFARRQSIYGL
jgi:hypothetical protein